MSKFKISDRVRLKGHQRIFVVVEVDPPGCLPLAPSTYTVRLALPPDPAREVAVATRTGAQQQEEHA